MTIDEIFLTQFGLSLLVYGLLAAWLVAPWLATRSRPEALFWLTVPHAFRHVGLVFLVPGVVSAEMPGGFAASAGYGDLAAGVLAITALIALRRGWGWSIALVWAVNIVGAADLANALRQTGVMPHFQSAWYIPTLVVPLLLVAHGMALWRLFGGQFRRPAGM